MWSGPRNISTAMMRAWENRPDTFVIDEPFYAYYLQRTAADHPGRDEVIAHGETDWKKVVTRLTSDPPNGKRIFYQKQMTHHLLPEIDRDWMLGLTNCFLIRDPAEVIASYTKKNREPTLEDVGFVQQEEIFNWLRARSGRPAVIDARDVLENPRKTLSLLCAAVGVEFTETMLLWPAGRRETDGIWAKYWYAEVEKSTAFQPHKSNRAEVPARLAAVHDKCREIYERLHGFRLQ
ncbi:MAG: HAD family hydrolase [Verrucomicrobiota bacterium]|nr:HAD family hydrolase [Verrucomicrobiota bacterium]